MKLILLTVESDLDPDALADALTAELVLKLRPEAQGETAELVRLQPNKITVLELRDLIGELLP